MFRASKFLCIISVFFILSACSSGNKNSGGQQHQIESREGKGKLTDTPVDSTKEILLPDANGNDRSIEQMHGDYVLMDVILNVPQKGDKHIARLKSVYQKYHSRGLQIYQICMSDDADAWRNVAKTYPWTAVYDNKTLQSELIEKYYVVTIPSMRLFSRDGKPMGDVNAEQLQQKLHNLLGK